MNPKTAMCQCDTVEEVVKLFVKELQECWHIEEEVAAATEECISCIESLIEDQCSAAADEAVGDYMTRVQKAIDRI